MKTSTQRLDELLDWWATSTCTHAGERGPSRECTRCVYDLIESERKTSVDVEIDWCQDSHSAIILAAIAIVEERLKPAGNCHGDLEQKLIDAVEAYRS